jgi:hypothetical protein
MESLRVERVEWAVRPFAVVVPTAFSALVMTASARGEDAGSRRC